MSSPVLEVRKDALGTTRLLRERIPEPAPGEVLLRVRRFALSANNITYGVLGDAVGYWQVFPAVADGWGRLPTWGFAEVVASAHPEVAEGRQLFGYVPMGAHLLVEPGRVNERGLTDFAAHRRELAPAYNAYRWLDADALYDPDHEDELLLFLPVFMLSFLLDVFLAEQAFFGARTVIVSSASSKASLGLARLLAARGVDVTGLTSRRNAAFVTGSAAYTRTLTYEKVHELPKIPAVYVDVAGTPSVRQAVHEHLGDKLEYSTQVGSTHRDAPAGSEPRPTWFFAPDHLRTRIAAWGTAEFNDRLGTALRAFAEWTRGWLTIRTSAGPDAVRTTYEAVATGAATPSESHILTMTRAATDRHRQGGW